MSLTIESDDYVGLVGPNGGGKTTLLKLLLGLIQPQSGTVKILGGLPRKTCNQIGYVPQHARMDLSVPARVLDVVLMARLSQSGWGWRYPRDAHERAHAALKDVGMDEYAQRHIKALSGGQRQRVLIARALASDAKILLLDEPTSGVDSQMEHDFYELLHRLNETLPIILVSHDIGFISAHVKHVACLNRKLVSHGAGPVSQDVIDAMYHAHGPVHHVHHDDDCGHH